MPYIKQERRKELDDALEELAEKIEGVGELNFAVTTLLLRYYDYDCGESYATFNSIMGVLECAKQEFYRRVLVPYEDKKCKENGDVY
ncbi:MAG: hypothetical protein MUP81_02305 [Dehalococcoidia bacterium]|nr:hypothetical protein [Dehalococcoidia bacterium]